MTSSKAPKADVKSVLAEFDNRKDMLAGFCRKTESLIEVSLQDANIRYHSVSSRVKDRKKLEMKYQDPTKNYVNLDDVTDLAGLRVITYYGDDIERVAKVIEREFAIDEENSVDKRDSEPDRFGYNALHFVCTHADKRISDVEYKRFAGVCCEIQITSILRHAWSEIEHEWYDLPKEAYGKDVKKRFYRLAALLDLAESEFLDIRTKGAVHKRAVDLLVEAKVPDILVDAASLQSFIEQDSTVLEIERDIARRIDRDLAAQVSDRGIYEKLVKDVKLTGVTKLQDLNLLLKKHHEAIPAFIERCQGIWVGLLSQKLPLIRGVSVYHLSMLLSSVAGKEQIETFFAERGFTTPLPWDIEQQVFVAREIVAKYSS